MEFKLLKFISFKELYLWDVKRFLSKKTTFSFPLTPIHKFAKNSKISVPIEDENLYKRITIRINGNGVVLRDEEKGVNIKTKQQFLAKEGQFILSKIDARNGAFGIVSKELDNAIITNSFSIYNIDTKQVNLQYLQLITTSNYFKNLCESVSNGTTGRRNITDEHFVSFEIPLPTLSEQKQILSDYNAKMQEAERLEREIENSKVLMYNELYKQLEIQIENTKISKNKLIFVNFKDISRWDFLFLSGGISKISTNIPKVRFADVISTFNSNYGKSIRINSVNYPENDFRYIGMEHVEKETGALLEMPEVKGNEIKSQTLQVPKGFMLFGKLRPYLNKYWTNNTDFDNIICSSEFLVFDINTKIVDKTFFQYILSSVIIQQQIADKSSGARMPRINETTFLNLEFPLPDFSIQKQIAAKLDTMVSEQKTKREKIAELKQQALQTFESKIFVNN